MDTTDLDTRFPKVRREKAAGYPDRFPVDHAHAAWDVPMPEYAPPYHVAPKVIAQDRTHKPGGWADPEDFLAVTLPARSHVGTLGKDAQGRPLNPMGRTGIAGRGVLGRWGPNFAADPLVLWLDGQDLKALFIQRKDQVIVDGRTVHPWAIPGGMADDGEPVAATLARELEEETGIALDFSPAVGTRVVAQGPVDDPRSTDHAWIETTVAYRLLSTVDGKGVESGMRAQDDAMGVRAVVLDGQAMRQLYASHGGFVLRALQDLLARQDVDARVHACARAALR